VRIEQVLNPGAADRVRDGTIGLPRQFQYEHGQSRIGSTHGQPHNPTNRNAARDFAMRMFQFFEHHLKGKPAPEWMEKGVPFIDREKEKEQWKKLYSASGK
jgi:hypothetical protein